MFWTKAVKVVCTISAASSWDKPYLKGIENTNRSYLFSTWCHAPTLPRRHRWINSRSGSATLCGLFISMNITLLSTATLLYSFQPIGLEFFSVFTNLTRHALTSNLRRPELLRLER
jgi:hypothetical protein